jgi:hypothetical protein
MFRQMKHKARVRRAIDYLREHPEDEPAVKAILSSTYVLDAKNAREAAEITGGRKVTDEEWRTYGTRWERAWYAIVR